MEFFFYNFFFIILLVLADAQVKGFFAKIDMKKQI
jgi:hypothetical protein